MIVISGALVLVALVLLVIGIVAESLNLVYASIGVSLVSFLALGIGVFQRRKLDNAEVDGPLATTLVPVGTTDDAGDTTVAPVRRSATTSAPAAGGEVLVVAGRPRYHVEGCRYLAGKNPDPVDVARAVADGFTSCGVCKPDEVLAARAATAQVPTHDAGDAAQEQVLEALDTSSEPGGEDSVDEGVDQAVAEPVTARVTRPTKRAAKPAAAAPTKVSKAAPVKADSAKAPAKAATKAVPAKATKPATKAAPATAAKRGSVIVIPDRGKFHQADCRYVRGVRGALELTKAQAVKQGYAACGVCNS